MPEVRLRTVDAFTDRPFTGNPRLWSCSIECRRMRSCHVGESVGANRQCFNAAEYRR